MNSEDVKIVLILLIMFVQMYTIVRSSKSNKKERKLNMVVRIKKVDSRAIIPTRGTQYAAGYDLYACGLNDGQIIKPGETVKIGTGICMEIPDSFFGAVFARSGLATKQGLRPANCVGVIDSDYRGEIIVAMHNDSNEERCIHNGDRIAQIVITPFLSAELEEVNDLSETGRGSGGFGSTDSTQH